MYRKVHHLTGRDDEVENDLTEEDMHSDNEVCTCTENLSGRANLSDMKDDYITDDDASSCSVLDMATFSKLAIYACTVRVKKKVTYCNVITTTIQYIVK